MEILQKAQELGINPQDIEEKFVTGSGAGGQKINKTASCVMLKHIPTGIIVKCQKHREQSKNRASAYKLLVLKIEELVKGKESELAKKTYKIKKQKQRRSRRAKEKMLHDKAHHSEIKEQRGTVRL
ncbi:MAG: peptide chain release factor-like protein [Candidatus Gracilibacteria bacterium]|jgi:protein subunit release factor B